MATYNETIGRMIKDLNDGEYYIYANNSKEYSDFVAWLTDKGAVFAYHFESGEGFTYKNKIVEVYGL